METSNNLDKNIKPILIIIIILMVILLGYYLLWKSISIKTKNTLINAIQEYAIIDKTKIKISGFPFNKKIKIENIKIDNGNYPYLYNKVIDINNVNISSSIFSNNLKIDVENVIYTTYTEDNELENTYTVTFQDKPIINIDFYSNAKLKSFNYSDSGYKVIDNSNQINNSTKNSKIDVNSIIDNNTIIYTIKSTITDTQNVKYEKNSSVSIDKKYSLYADMIYSITTDEGEFNNSSLKINNITLSNENINVINVTGEVLKDVSDKYSYGNLKVIFSDYKDTLEKTKKEVIKSFKGKEDEKEYMQISQNVFKVFEKLIKKNKETTNSKGVLDIEREKNYYDYFINNESFYKTLQDLIR